MIGWLIYFLDKKLADLSNDSSKDLRKLKQNLAHINLN
jgi:hypothetical protein